MSSPWGVPPGQPPAQPVPPAQQPAGQPVPPARQPAGQPTPPGPWSAGPPTSPGAWSAGPPLSPPAWDTPAWHAPAAAGSAWQPPGPRPRRLPPHAEPQPYHRILRTRSYHWVRPLVGLLVLVGSFFVLGSVVFVPWVLATGGSMDALDSTTPSTLLLINLSLAVGIPAAMLALLAGHQLRPGWLGSVVPRLRWRLLVPFGGIALLVTLVSLGASMLLSVDEESATEVGTVTWHQWSSFAIVILLTTPLQSAGEEFVFRGYLLQVLGAWVRAPWVGALVTSGLFALAHGGQNPALFTDRFAFGLLAAWLVWRTGGLEASIAFHAVNNVVTFLISAAYDQVNDSLNVSDIPWSYAALDIVSMAVLGLLVHLYLRRRPVRRRTDAA